jgi:AraC-like DNA-binding protein
MTKQSPLDRAVQFLDANATLCKDTSSSSGIDLLSGVPSLVARVREYLHWCFNESTAPRADELAGFLGISRATLCRRFGTAGLASPAAYLKAEQLAYAKELLRASSQSIATVAAAAGFGSDRSLYRMCWRMHQQTPGGLRATGFECQRD